MHKILILYYSYEGSTKQLAQAIATNLSVDIEPITPVTEQIVKTGLSKYLWGGRQVLMKAKPAIEPLTVDIADYDFILIGSPVWAGTFAPPIRTLFDQPALVGKSIACFFTHKGGPGKVVAKAKQLVEQKNTWIGGTDFKNPTQDQATTTAAAIHWAKSVVPPLDENLF